MTTKKEIDARTSYICFSKQTRAKAAKTVPIFHHQLTSRHAISSEIVKIASLKFVDLEAVQNKMKKKRKKEYCEDPENREKEVIS